jgi:putative membrane protein
MKIQSYNLRGNQQGSRESEHNAFKGLAAGIIGGLIASWVMNEFQALVSKSSQQKDGDKSQQSSSAQSNGGQSKAQGQQQQNQDSEEEDDATVKAAQAISETLLDHSLAKSEKKPAGAAAHYAMGATSGALYGIAAEVAPVVSSGAGLPFGAAVWLVADDIVVPALGLSKPLTEYPLSTHAYALASHFVYGLTTDIVRRVVRRAL